MTETVKVHLIHKEYVFNKTENSPWNFAEVTNRIYQDLDSDKYDEILKVIYTFMKNYLQAYSDKKRLKVRNRASDVLNDLHKKYNIIDVEATDLLETLIKSLEWFKDRVPVMCIYYE